MTTQYDLTTAMRFGALAHAGQTRKGNDDPAFVHPRRVSAMLRVFYPEAIDLQTAALLHDTVEDTDVTIEDIRAWFGADIAYLVDAVTNTKEHGFVHSKDPRVLRLKVSDLYDNMAETYRSIEAGRDVWRLFLSGAAKVRRWRDHMDHILSIIGDEDLAQRADDLLRRIEAVAPKPTYTAPTKADTKSASDRFRERYGFGPSIWDDIDDHLGKGKVQ